MEKERVKLADCPLCGEETMLCKKDYAALHCDFYIFCLDCGYVSPQSCVAWEDDTAVVKRLIEKFNRRIENSEKIPKKFRKNLISRKDDTFFRKNYAKMLSSRETQMGNHLRFVIGYERPFRPLAGLIFIGARDSLLAGGGRGA